MLSEDPEAFRKISSSSSSTSAAENISNATDLERLSAALDPVNGWDYEPEQTLAMRCARAHVGEGSYRLDQVRSLPCALHHKAHQEHPLGTWQHLLATLFVGAINEWGVEQPRVLLLSTTAYYRVKVEGGLVQVVRVALDKLTRIEVTRGTVRITAMEPLKDAAAGRWLSSATAVSSVAAALWSEIRSGERPQPDDTTQFETTREYRPYGQLLPSEALAALAAALSKAAELLNAARGGASFRVPQVETVPPPAAGSWL